MHHRGGGHSLFTTVLITYPMSTEVDAHILTSQSIKTKIFMGSIHQLCPSQYLWKVKNTRNLTSANKWSHIQTHFIYRAASYLGIGSLGLYNLPILESDKVFLHLIHQP